jgi:hypothetical protein
MTFILVDDIEEKAFKWITAVERGDRFRLNDQKPQVCQVKLNLK